MENNMSFRQRLIEKVAATIEEEVLGDKPTALRFGAALGGVTGTALGLAGILSGGLRDAGSRFARAGMLGLGVGGALGAYAGLKGGKLYEQAKPELKKLQALRDKGLLNDDQVNEFVKKFEPIMSGKEVAPPVGDITRNYASNRLKEYFNKA